MNCINFNINLYLVLILAVVLGDDCEMDCSRIIEPVCGMVTERSGSTTTKHYQNICFFNRMKCRLKNIAYIQQISDEKCGIKPYESRRVHDFSIPGGHQACNHTCPTYCVDTYDPVCAAIKYPNRRLPVTRTMINHCHVDLFSCSVGVNVSITHMQICLQPISVKFMVSVAAMKTLGFLHEPRRRSSISLNSNVGTGLKEHTSSELFDDVGVRHASAETSRLGTKEEAGAAGPLGWIVIIGD